MKKKQLYFEIDVALDGSWANQRYTYASSIELQTGTIISVPFGKTHKIGVVRHRTKKPTFTAKDVADTTTLVLPKRSLQLLDWMTDYYPSLPASHVQQFAPSFVTAKTRKALAEKKDNKILTPLPPLTKTQKLAFADISTNTSQNFVLHGITGSGKTRLYMELIKKYLKLGTDVLVLYPEISLTAQLLDTLNTHFGDNVHVYHSTATKKQQKQSWHQALQSSGGNIFIGPRSALFLPYKKLGLVILDEAHDGAYKQDSGTRYSGAMVAAALAAQHSAKLIYASATPPVQETHQLLSKGGKLVCMHELATQHNKEKKLFQIVNMTDKKNYTISHLLSKQLVTAIENSLKKGQQSLLFLNRRGTARLTLCEECGWHAICKRCDLPLTYHHDSFTQRCHLCGFSQQPSTSCPDCKSQISQKTLGIKAIEEELKKKFPAAKIGRFDSDNKKKDSITENFKAIRSGTYQILLGTQLITKGLDLPLLETVGILQADSALFLPDYSSTERAFQQLTQVSGRVGRGHIKGHVIVQTYQPKSSLLAHVEGQDWHNFYEEELENRKKLHYPPYSFVARVWVLKTSAKAAENYSQKIRDMLDQEAGLNITGPAPSFYEKVQNKYSWQLVLRSHSRKKLVEVLEKLPKEVRYDIDPVSLL